VTQSTPTTRVQVRSVGVNSSLTPLGLNPDHTVQVPGPRVAGRSRADYRAALYGQSGWWASYRQPYG